MRLFNVYRVVLLAGLLCFGNGAVAESSEVTGDESEDAAGNASETGTHLAVGEIAAVLVAANNGEIVQGQIAVQRASNPSVRAFAAKMVAHHSQANQEVTDLLSALGMAPVDSVLSQSLALRGLQEAAFLQVLSGPLFDVAYMTMQVMAHQRVLVMLEDTLIPPAQEQPILALLEKTRTMVTSHLALALSIRQSLGAGSHV